jgi:type III restriction enzyme
MSLNTARSIAGRLSLREPQWESLQKLVAAIETVPDLRNHKARTAEELTGMIEALKAQFETLSDFERDFPSFCFALATGVGKTRLMGAFISYLHSAYGYRHFFVLAPNLTIYNKLIVDFTPNTPKYVFKGIAEFAVNAPKVITGDNYDQQNMTGGELLGDVHINIFNISKINSEVRGGKSPRIKRLSEYLGQSYFEYLASLPDLILLMDESHRYRASAGIKALNDLQPLLGLELTATPFVENNSGKPTPFKNVVMDYPLARAIEDGFVKEPAVVTQQNFNPADHSAEQLERIKLMDGVRVHEETKVHLLTYAQQTGQKLVKPFMLVIARDTTHASQLMTLMQSADFFNGYYAGKVIQVDSGTTSGAEGDAVIEKLLAVESYNEPTEIVIHVNMLKEGWDVTNLYTIVPLRAANARTLIEQSIGRGLRLPYGRKTGDEAVDRLNIIAHDRFQEVIDEAGRADSPIRMKVLELSPAGILAEKPKTVIVTSTVETLLGISNQQTSHLSITSGVYKPINPTQPVLNEEQSKVAYATMNVIQALSRHQSFVPNSAALNQAAVLAEIVKQVEAIVTPQQLELLASAGPSVTDIVKQTVNVVTQHTIDIPRILVKPKGAMNTGFKVFSLDVSRMNYQPADQQLVSRSLQSGQEVTYGRASNVLEPRLENYIVRELINYDDVSYDDHADLINDLATQTVQNFRSYLANQEDLHSVLSNYAKPIAENIHSQMLAHYYEDATEVEVVVSQGFTPLKPSAITAVGEVLTLAQLPAERSKIAQAVYGGFSKCAYTYQKFHSDTERIFASILERDAQLWLRPVAGQFNIYYRNGVYESEYVPDFVASTDTFNLIIETKKAADIESHEVQAKATAAKAWCKNASDYSQMHGGKPWKYCLVPHDKVSIASTLEFFKIYT